MEPTLTERQRQRYLADGGVRCPHCRSNLLEAGAPQADGPNAWCEVTCLACKVIWTDRYTLTNITEGGAP